MELKSTFHNTKKHLRGLMNPEEQLNFIYAITCMKFISDLCREKKYLRIPHKLSGCNFNYSSLISPEDCIKEIAKLKELQESFNVLLEDLIKKDNWDSIKIVIEEIKKVDFTKNILRGAYSETVQDILNSYCNSLPEKLKNTTSDVVAKLLFNILQVSDEESIFDPFIGAGKLAFTVGEKSKKIFGIDINNEAIAIARLNCAIGNMTGSFKVGDFLADPTEAYDVVISNYPFNFRRTNDDILNHYNKWGEVPVKRNCDFAFISMSIMKAKKRGAIITPEGTLFRGGIEGKIREKILKEKFLETIISLPGGALENTGIKTNLLIFSKEKKNDSILFINSESYFNKSRSNLLINSKDMEELVKIYYEKIEKQGISKKVTLEEILENKGVLNVNRYISTSMEKIDFENLETEVKKLNTEINKYKEKTDNLLKTIAIKIKS
jgi:type I restriction enzyme M protein